MVCKKLSELIEKPFLRCAPEICGIVYDSRKVRKGDLFIAIKGFRTDGHLFVREAIKRGARAVIVEKFLGNLPVYQVVTRDSRFLLSLVSANFYDNPSQAIQVIGITGTNGKTTTAYLIQHLLNSIERGKVCGLLSTIENDNIKERRNSEMTTPEAPEIHFHLKQILKNGGKYNVMEVSSHSIALKRVEHVEFTAGVYTNLSRDHLDFHGTMENYFLAKLSFLKKVKNLVVLNDEDPYTGIIKREVNARKIMTFGFKSGDLHIKRYRTDLSGTEFETTGYIEGRFKSRLIGEFNILNILGALLIAKELTGADIESLRGGIEVFKGVPGRFEPFVKGGDIQVIVDYAHTPDAMEKVLRTAKRLTNGRVIVIFGAGGNRDEGKRPEMGRIAEEFADRVILTNDNPRNEEPERIIEGILKGIKDRSKTKVILNREEAIYEGIRVARAHDIVLILGKGHEDYMEVNGERFYFSDRETVKRILKEAGYEVYS